MKLLAIIDPIEQLNPAKDSSIAMLAAAERQDLEIYIATQQDLFVDQGAPFGRVSALSLSLNKSQWYRLKEPKLHRLASFDIILMRKDPPFDMNYIYTTYLLELAENHGALVCNKPQGLRDANEKYVTSLFPSHAPPTLISQSIDQLSHFWHEHQDVIYKPLDGMGGRDIFHVDSHGANLMVILEALTKDQTTPIMAQRYLPEVTSSGDKRILIIGDEVVPYTLARIPRQGERGNLVRGAQGNVMTITSYEKQMAESVIPKLNQMGLFFIGLDVIGNHITEINVTSPTCICEIEKETQAPVSDHLIEKLVGQRELMLREHD